MHAFLIYVSKIQRLIYPNVRQFIILCIMLKNNLTKSMQKSAAWAALADALQVVISSVVEPTLERLKARPRLFDMHPDDVKTLLDELGSVVSIGKVSVTDRPLLLQQRLDEVHQKNTLYPLKKTLQREFSNIRVAWKPLYAPINVASKPYGALFARDVDRPLYPDVPLDGWFKTSRGVLQVNITDLYLAYGGQLQLGSIEQFLADVDQVMRPLLPTRIVYDGQLFLLEVSVRDAGDSIKKFGSDLDVTLMPAVRDPVYRLGRDQIGSVRVGSDLHARLRTFSATTELSYDFGKMYQRAPTRLGADRLGASRLGINRQPPDVRFKSFEVSIFN